MLVPILSGRWPSPGRSMSSQGGGCWPLIPGVSRGLLLLTGQAIVAFQAPPTPSLQNNCDFVCLLLLVVCVSSDYRRSHIVSLFSIFPSPTLFSLRGRLRHAKYPHPGWDSPQSSLRTTIGR